MATAAAIPAPTATTISVFYTAAFHAESAVPAAPAAAAVPEPVDAAPSGAAAVPESEPAAIWGMARMNECISVIVYVCVSNFSSGGVSGSSREVKGESKTIIKCILNKSLITL